MIESLSRATGRSVSREAFEKIIVFNRLLREENDRQNLVSRSTLNELWNRHVLDSAQLVRFEPKPAAKWCDIGSGGGLPGLIIAALVEGPVALVEPRRLRAEFLRRAAEAMGIAARMTVHQQRAERLAGAFDVITARAVAPLSALLDLSQHLSTRKSVWVLPKGRGAQSELAEAKRRWQGVFHVEQSITDADSHIIVGRQVRLRHG